MIALSKVSIGGIVVGLLILVIVFATLRSMVNIVQQGEVGVLQRLGEYRKTHEPGSSSSPRSSTDCSTSTCVRSRCRATARK